MNDTIRVNFHCHTLFSDGDLTPESLAQNLAEAGVRYAALTDHDTLEGLPRFKDALKKRGIAYLPGVEITTTYKGRELHLLGYGFDETNSELIATLISIRQIHHTQVHSIETSIRKAGINRLKHVDGTHHTSKAPSGVLHTQDAIDLIHKAGGLTVLAHPLFFENDYSKLDDIISDLKAKGLDGVECLYSPFSVDDQMKLRELADKYALFISAGTDFHGKNGKGSQSFGIDIDRTDWIKFRKAFMNTPILTGRRLDGESLNQVENRSHDSHVTRHHHFRKRYFISRIFLPTFFAIALFLITLWLFILPSFEKTLMDRKRELIKELTNSAISIASSYEHDEKLGLISQDDAKAMAISRIETLRYGPEGKDYFWIQDMQPKMVMHPYRQDLNGKDLGDFSDPRGVKIFVEFALLVSRSNEGYIDYVWQWKDDPNRIEPKESFVKGFAPWGWIIGTGIYTDDVAREIEKIEQNLIITSVSVSGVIIFLLIFVLQQSLQIERERQEVMDNLRESTNRYHALIEVTTEGTLLVLEGHCRYANPTFLNVVGYTSTQMEFLQLADLLPQSDENSVIWGMVNDAKGDVKKPSKAVDGFLKRSDGTIIECVLTLNPIEFDNQNGFILLAKDLSRPLSSNDDFDVSISSQYLPIGLFKAKTTRNGIFTAINNYTRSLLEQISLNEDQQFALADLFPGNDEYQDFHRLLDTDGFVNEYIIHHETIDASTKSISITARLTSEETNRPKEIIGFMRDVSEARKKDTEREVLINRLQSSLLFLHEPLSTLSSDFVTCSMETSIQQLAKILTDRNHSAALVSGGNNSIIGIVTDHDLRARVLVDVLDIHSPIYSIMTAPVTRISENALVFEALMRMEENGVRYLAVEDQGGKIVNLVDNKSLIQYNRFAPIVLSREILRARNIEEVITNCERKNHALKSMIVSSVQPRHATQMLGVINDAAVTRLIQLAITKLGEPPVPFVFIAMGSHGRNEQTLVTDQDNGIIFKNGLTNDPQKSANYFLEMGQFVCECLEKAGYPFCQGEIMANNPRWCRSLEEWEVGFAEWIEKAEPQEVINFSISLDFRPVYGDEELSNTLRVFTHNVLQNRPAFYYQLAQNAIQFKPPYRLLGNIYLPGGLSDFPGEINLKDAIMPIASFARLYALRHHIQATHTIDRLDALEKKQVIQKSSLEEITTAYDFLMRLRLQNQLLLWESGKPIHNRIQPDKLGHIQQEMLKQAFSQIAAIQKKISYDFLGGT